MKLLTTSAICLLILATTSCDFGGLGGRRVRGNGNMTTITKDVPEINRIDVVGDIDVELSQGQSSVKITADENLLDYIKVEENDGWLRIRTRDGYNLESDEGVTSRSSFGCTCIVQRRSWVCWRQQSVRDLDKRGCCASSRC